MFILQLFLFIVFMYLIYVVVKSMIGIISPKAYKGAFSESRFPRGSILAKRTVPGLLGLIFVMAAIGGLSGDDAPDPKMSDSERVVHDLKETFEDDLISAEIGEWAPTNGKRLDIEVKGNSSYVAKNAAEQVISRAILTVYCENKGTDIDNVYVKLYLKLSDRYGGKKLSPAYNVNFKGRDGRNLKCDESSHYLELSVIPGLWEPQFIHPVLR